VALFRLLHLRRGDSLRCRLAERCQRRQLLFELEDGLKKVAGFFYPLQYLVRGKNQQLGSAFFQAIFYLLPGNRCRDVGWSLARSE